MALVFVPKRDVPEYIKKGWHIIEGDGKNKWAVLMAPPQWSLEKERKDPIQWRHPALPSST